MSDRNAELAAAIWREPKRIILVFLVVTVALHFASAKLSPRDDTDGSKRSGMIIMTDCRTGLQYLTTRNGGLTPRLLADGSQILEPCD